MHINKAGRHAVHLHESARGAHVDGEDEVVGPGQGAQQEIEHEGDGVGVAAVRQLALRSHLQRRVPVLRPSPPLSQGLHNP